MKLGDWITTVAQIVTDVTKLAGVQSPTCYRCGHKLGMHPAEPYGCRLCSCPRFMDPPK